MGAADGLDGGEPKQSTWVYRVHTRRKKPQKFVSVVVFAPGEKYAIDRSQNDDINGGSFIWKKS